MDPVPANFEFSAYVDPDKLDGLLAGAAARQFTVWTNPEDAGALAGKYKGDRTLLRARVNAALEELRKNPRTDPDRLATIGYCFGGTTALELARIQAEKGDKAKAEEYLSRATGAAFIFAAR